MNLTANFESVELRFKQILEDFFISVYGAESPPSHDISHHRRVWDYAKELTLILFRNNRLEDSFSFSGLIIACYLHDIGMSVDDGIIHGHHSREITFRFLQNYSLSDPEYKDVLQAVENHDNKNYGTDFPKNNIHSILSMADDLDAFGYTGIYRYVEIYLAREISPPELGFRVLENSQKRFGNFIKTFDFSENLILKHKKRFDILHDFFSQYNRLAEKYKFGNERPSGYCGVIDIFDSMLKSRKKLQDLYLDNKIPSDDIVINRFFKALKSELLSADEPLNS